MNTTIEQKMLQTIIFTFEISFSAISGLLDYCVFPRCKVTELRGFLNKLPYKHILFHLHYNDLPCCECPKVFKIEKRRVLTEKQFGILFRKKSQNHHHIIKTTSGVMKQDCLCNYDAETGVTLNHLDITLMVAILRNCCQSFFPPAVINWLDDIREIRNLIFHVGRLNAFKETELDKMLQDLETLVMQISGQVPFQSFQTSIKTQICLLTSTTIQQEGARNIIEKTEYMIEAEKNQLINLITGKADKLEVKMEILHKETLQCYKKGTEDLKCTVGDHFDANSKRQDHQTVQIKQGISDMEKNVKDDSKAMSTDIKTHTDVLYQRQHDTSVDIKTELKENQEVIKERQKDHTVKLTSIENISEDVLHTTTETKYEQSKQTSVIATIQDSVEKLEAKGLNEEDKEGLKKLKESFDKIKNLADVLGGCDVGCQTDLESIQFELGENSRSVIESIQTGTDHIQTQNDNVERKISEVMKSIERIQGHFDTNKSTGPKSVCEVEEPDQAIAVSVLKVFIRKAFRTKEEMDEKQLDICSTFACKANTIWDMMSLPMRLLHSAEIKEKVDALKQHIKLQMNTLESLIYQFIDGKASKEAIETVQSLGEIKIEITQIRELFKKVNERLGNSEFITKRYIEQVLSYLQYFDNCIAIPFYNAGESTERTIRAFTREHLAFTACNCFMDLFSLSVFLDLHI